VHAFDAEDHLRQALSARGVPLVARQYAFVGAGEHAMAAWDAFRDMVAEPVQERFADRTGEVLAINRLDGGDLLLFDASLSPRLSDDDNPHIGDEEPEVSCWTSRGSSGSTMTTVSTSG